MGFFHSRAQGCWKESRKTYLAGCCCIYSYLNESKYEIVWIDSIASKLHNPFKFHTHHIAVLSFCSRSLLPVAYRVVQIEYLVCQSYSRAQSTISATQRQRSRPQSSRPNFSRQINHHPNGFPSILFHIPIHLAEKHIPMPNLTSKLRFLAL